jgi:tetratricopeptide (TPR) repeat protein
MNRLQTLILLLVFGIAAAASGALLTDPAQIMNEAYISLVQGDQSLDAGRFDEAQGFYAQAKEHYDRLSREFPGFEPRIIQYRTTYCDNQLASVERRRELAQQEAAAPPPEPEPSIFIPPASMAGRAPAAPAPIEPAPPPAAPATADRSMEVDYLRSRVQSLEAEVAEFDTLQDEIDELVVQNDRLTRQMEAMGRQLEEATARLAAQDRDGTQEADLRALLAQKDARIRELELELEAKRELEMAFNDMEARFNEVSASNGMLTREIERLDLELDDAEIRADQALMRAEQAEGRLAGATGAATVFEPSEPPSEPVEDVAQAAPAAPPPEAAAPRPPRRPPPPVAAQATEEIVEPLPIPPGTSPAEFVRRLLQEGRNAVALATVREAMRTEREDMNLALIEGIALIRLQRYSEAASGLIEIAKQNPRNPEVNATLGAAMMGAGFYDEAREALQMALKLDKNLPECHYNLAQLYAFVEPINVRLARRHYRNARDLGLAADPQLESALR